MLFKYYVKKYATIKELRYDLDTVTVDDFAVELEISIKQYKQFLKQYLKDDEALENGSVAVAFKKYLKNKIETVLEEQETDCNLRGTCEIFDIQLAFHNRKVIEKLQNRGNFIASGDLKSVNKLNQKINQILKKKGEKEKLCEITHAYIVFKYERGHDIALEYTTK